VLRLEIRRVRCSARRWGSWRSPRASSRSGRTSGAIWPIGWGFVAYIASFGLLIGINFAVSRSEQLAVGLLFGFGVLVGVGTAPTIAYYASTNPQSVWQAGGATALFIAGFGTAGYATRRDLSGLARACFWALLVLIVFGIVAIFVNIPHGALIYSIAGLVIFAGFTLYDFQRLRRTQDIRAAPLLAASIFLDVLNVFLLFLNLFNRN
jgi:FtsH-binding integral membrane protein